MDQTTILIICYSSLQAVLTLCVIGVASIVTKRVYIETQWMDTQGTNNYKLFEFWFSTIWKMRNVYVCLLVHIFDFITDLLVIHQWFIEEENNDTEHIDSTVMAYCALTIIIFYKLVSSLAVFVTYEYNIYKKQYYNFLMYYYLLKYMLHILDLLIELLKKKKIKNLKINYILTIN